MSIDIIPTTPGVVAALIIGTLAAIQPTTIQAEDGTQLVDDLRAIFGKHHARANHAKGVMLEGTFAPMEAARALSRAAVFAGTTVANAGDFTERHRSCRSHTRHSQRGVAGLFWRAPVTQNGELTLTSNRK